MTMRICTTIVLAILIGVTTSTAQVKKELTQAEAIRVAEQFVAENGYTDLPTMRDKTKLSYESIDPFDPDERLKERLDTLERKAYAVARGNVRKYGWTIVFRYNANNEEHRRMNPDYEKHSKIVGRAVTMSADGSNIRMQHQEIYLRGLKVIR